MRKTIAYVSLAALGALSCNKKASMPSGGEAAEQSRNSDITIVEKEESSPGLVVNEAPPPVPPAADPAATTATPLGGGEAKMGKTANRGGVAQGQLGTIGYGNATGSGGRYQGGPPAKKPPSQGKFNDVTDGKRRPVEADGDGRDDNSESYIHYDVNKMTLVVEDHLSTFAVDVDTASYSIARRKILEGHAVPRDAVRVEEFVNYFGYGYAPPAADAATPFAVHMEAAPSPFNPKRHILRVGVKGKEVAKRDRKKAHLVFLVDVSGSMSSADKLPLAQRSLRILVDNLGEGDTVALVTYAGSTRVVLQPTTMDRKAEIYAAIDELSAGGSTAMGSGIELAYGIAAKQVAPDSVTRVIVLSDGDANVGNTSHESILKSIKHHVAEGVTLSTIGFGMGNYKDGLMEQLANKGNGNNYYIDSLSQAKRVFQEQLGGTLEVIAQDVKIQVDFNPKSVKAYRLVGYENRDIADQDFRNDKVDAGEIGAGHAVTAVYEVELADKPEPMLATVRLRAKKPRGTEAAEHAYPFLADMRHARFDDASADFRFAVAVVAFAEILRQSPYADGWNADTVLSIARAATPAGNEEREEFLGLVGKWLKQRKAAGGRG